MVSLLPVALGCQAACPFCFSKASVSADQETAPVDFARVRRVLAEGRRRGAERAVITGGGEPGLLRFDRLTALVRECAQLFPKVVLITNGFFLQDKDDSERTSALAALADAGLGVLSVSCHHHDEQRNAEIMRLRTRPEAHCGVLVGDAGSPARNAPALGVRAPVRRRGFRGGPARLPRLGGGGGVSEVCFKELYVSTSQESVYHSHEANEWSRDHQVPLSLVLEFAGAQGWAEADRLPWGAPCSRSPEGPADGAWRRTPSRASSGSAAGASPAVGT